ncbi:MAG: hypothetical protein HC883_01150 [Bdellovibrionaceae bacterium]|nr:hypothetical protein [Pseudobdellovibrionaceae bacterium]
MKFGLFSVILTLLATVANAESELPFTPVNAADQKVITSKSIEEELEQFRYIAEWATAQAVYETNRLKFDQATKELDRAKTLLEAGTITSLKFSGILYQHKLLEGEMIRLSNEILKAKINAEFHRLRVLEEGNPGQDYKAELSQILVDGLLLDISSVTSQLNVARTSNEMASAHFNNGKALAASNRISKAELEQRQLIANTTATQVASLERQLRVIRIALTNFENNVKRAKKNRD